MSKDFVRKKNPHANDDGSPKEGEEDLFFEFEIAESKRYYESLSEEEKKLYDQDAKAMNDRMNS